jgi:hypothetical protein
MPEKSTYSVTDANWLNKLPIFAGVLALSLVIVYAFTFRKLPADENPAAWGTFGDFVGGLLNPLFGFLTLLVALRVLQFQRLEFKKTLDALKQSTEVAARQFQSSERARCEATYVSCRDDITRAVATVADTSSNCALAPLTFVKDLSKALEETHPLIGINSHAVSFECRAPGYETPLPITSWDWSISHGNDAREMLRLMLPLCRSIGDMLVAVNSMPAEEQAEKLPRLRNSLDEWTLSTFTYFLVLHPDGAKYQTAAAAAHVLINLRIQRALSFAKAYLPAPTYSIPT